MVVRRVDVAALYMELQLTGLFALVNAITFTRLLSKLFNCGVIEISMPSFTGRLPNAQGPEASYLSNREKLQQSANDTSAQYGLPSCSSRSSSGSAPSANIENIRAADTMIDTR